MNEVFKTDAELLISLVEKRPALWDRTHESYKNKRMTFEAWKEVCCEFQEDFETLSDRDKNDLGKVIMKKWGNIRDNWMKCHKKLQEPIKAGKTHKKRKYLYYDELRFLEKIVNHRSTSPNLTDNDAFLDTQNEKMDNEKKPKNKQTANDLNEKTADVSFEQGQSKIMFTTLDALIEPGQSRIMSFFKSIAPTIDKFHDDDIVEFQYEVMRLIKDIKSKNENCQIILSYEDS